MQVKTRLIVGMLVVVAIFLVTFFALVRSIMATEALARNLGIVVDFASIDQTRGLVAYRGDVDENGSPLSSSSGGMAALDIKSGGILWKTSFDEHAVSALGVNAPRDEAYLGSLSTSEIAVIDITSGHFKSVISLDKFIPSKIYICRSGDRAYIGSTDGSIILFDLIEHSVVNQIQAHEGSVESLAVDEQLGIVWTSGWDADLNAWSAELNGIKHSYSCSSIAWELSYNIKTHSLFALHADALLEYHDFEEFKEPRLIASGGGPLGFSGMAIAKRSGIIALARRDGEVELYALNPSTRLLKQVSFGRFIDEIFDSSQDNQFILGLVSGGYVPFMPELD